MLNNGLNGRISQAFVARKGTLQVFTQALQMGVQGQTGVQVI